MLVMGGMIEEWERTPAEEAAHQREMEALGRVIEALEEAGL